MTNVTHDTLQDLKSLDIYLLFPMKKRKKFDTLAGIDNNNFCYIQAQGHADNMINPARRAKLFQGSQFLHGLLKMH